MAADARAAVAAAGSALRLDRDRAAAAGLCGVPHSPVRRHRPGTQGPLRGRPGHNPGRRACDRAQANVQVGRPCSARYNSPRPPEASPSPALRHPPRPSSTPPPLTNSPAPHQLPVSNAPVLRSGLDPLDGTSFRAAAAKDAARLLAIESVERTPLKLPDDAPAWVRFPRHAPWSSLPRPRLTRGRQQQDEAAWGRAAEALAVPASGPSRTAITLLVHGWGPSTQPDCVGCTTCARTVGLWQFQPGQPLDVVHEHWWFCPHRTDHARWRDDRWQALAAPPAPTPPSPSGAALGIHDSPKVRPETGAGLRGLRTS